MPTTPKKDPPAPRRMRFVVVPRAVFEQYCHEPWADVVAAAQAGTDGLSTLTDDYFSLPPFTPDTAVLRAGDTGQCFLFKQNW